MFWKKKKYESRNSTWNDLYNMFDWVQLTENGGHKWATDATRVPGGWLVLHTNYNDEYMPISSSMAFIKDRRNGKWVPGEKPDFKPKWK